MDPSAGTEQRQTGGCLPGALEPGMGQPPLLHIITQMRDAFAVF